jgi:hypothetical protein
MGHLHHKSLPILREIVTGLPNFNIEHQGVCKGCTLGKHAKVTFPRSEHKSKGILDLVHSDVCGPMSVASITGSMYYVSFIDDFSRKTWIYFLKTKDEVFRVGFTSSKLLLRTRQGEEVQGFEIRKWG